TGAGRVAALSHEAVDHAVEDHAVVESFARQLLDAADMTRRDVGAQLDHHRPVLERQDQETLGILGHHFTSAGMFTSQAEYLEPSLGPTRAISALNHAPLGSITLICGRSAAGKSAST